MKAPENLRYTKDHEWLLDEDGLMTVGITEHAQEQLGDVVFVELPEVGGQLTKGQAFGSVESVKAVSDLFAPIDGEVVEVNGDLEDTPETVNSDPYGSGWMLKVKPSGDVSEGLLTAAEYQALIAS